MPTAESILDSLRQISQRYQNVAIAWHMIIYSFLVVYTVSNKIPPARYLFYFISGLLLSVATVSWVAGNPFNGIVFGLGFLGMLYLSKKSPVRKAEVSALYQATGLLFMIAGLLYPHFLEGDLVSYLYAAPTGLIPCPTLLFISGLMLLLPYQISKCGYGIILLDLLYGTAGVFSLHIYGDALLFGAAAILLVRILSGFNRQVPAST